ncbi:MAG: hypothetical protein F6K44_08380 [Moorea sp. SIO3E2]|nr:hypothetical protein [Moorena sp. SIO3E2]
MRCTRSRSGRAGKMPTLLLFITWFSNADRTGIFSGGQDAHSTPIQREDSAMPNYLDLISQLSLDLTADH